MENNGIKRLEKKEEKLEIKEKAIVEKEKKILREEEKQIKDKEAILEKEEKSLKEKEGDVLAKERRIKIGEDVAIIEERSKKVINFFKNNPAWIFIIILVLLVILGVYIRSQPLVDHGGKPGLWDPTLNDYTLGPDLDPFLFLRYAKTMILNGSLPHIDAMRNVPLGFDTSTELQMVPYMIVVTYKMVNLFGTHSINFAGAFMPVWIFALTIIAFFFFVREVFTRKDEKESYSRANWIASISTFFMIVIPEFLPRTVAGIPEKESVAFLFMFLAFYLFLKAWKSEKIQNACIFGILAGISTGLMGLTWGGVTYIYITIGLAGLIGFVLNKVGTKELAAYALWFISSLFVILLSTNRFSLKGFLTSIDSGMAFLVLIIIIVHLIIWRTKIKELLKLDKIKLPKTIITIIITIILALILVLVVSPSTIKEKTDALYVTLVNPVTGRWSTTVAENKQPYFSEWGSSFGPNIGNFPVLFWLFFAGSAMLFYKMFNKIKKRDRWTLTLLYILFFLGLVFSRYAPHPNIFDGEGPLSLVFYFGSALLLVVMLIYYYISYHKKQEEGFEKIDFDYIFLFALFVLTLFTARSAVRLIMVLAPIAPIFVGYLIVGCIEKYKRSREADSTFKVLLMIFIILVLILGAYSGFVFYNKAKVQAYNNVPYYYTAQWQDAMAWVRENTSQNAVFAHWWDYGYWVQSIGNRATVTDGGNAIVWWNYLTGRYVLTGDNQKDALEFLHNHNATHLLIDPTDIGKYGAFSQIGSNETYDRLSQGPITLLSDQKQIQETKNGTLRSYNMPAGNGKVSVVPMEEDLVFDESGTKKTLFKENSGLIGVVVSYAKDEAGTSFEQPSAVFISEGKQVSIPMRYFYYDGRLLDYKSGINAAASIIPRIGSNTIDQMGAMMYISPRVMRGLLAQIYILNNSMGNFDNFKIVHMQRDIFSQNLIDQGYTLGEFNYFDSLGTQGPIKIWEIEYTGNEKANPDYLLKQPPAYITWKF